MGKATVICRDLAPPSEPRRKGFSGVFLKLINLTAVICIVSLIADIAHTKSDSPITLLSSTVTDAKSTRLGEGLSRSGTGGSVLRPEKIGTAKDAPLLNESGIKAEFSPHRPGSVTNNSSANSEEKAKELNEWESIRMRVTAYCPCPKCCGQYSDGVTACGYKIRPGDTFVAADRRYSFGTEMLIPGYSNGLTVKVLDRGGTIKGNRLDVFFATHQEALEWGVKYLEVSVRWKNL
ncbi:MAG: 3D domain-containing protein [Planctomycetes bacterium]|nr:3D domain-containing protein [Planctomycetota bacterium]